MRMDFNGNQGTKPHAPAMPPPDKKTKMRINVNGNDGTKHHTPSMPKDTFANREMCLSLNGRDGVVPHQGMYDPDKKKMCIILNGMDGTSPHVPGPFPLSSCASDEADEDDNPFCSARSRALVFLNAMAPACRRPMLRQLVLSMLRRDDELRLSDEVQQRYAACGDDSSDKEAVSIEVQKQVVHEHGFHGKVEVLEGLEVLRSALYLFPGDAEVRDAAHYLRYNIVKDCPLVLNSPVPDMPLLAASINPNGPCEPTSLHDVAKQADLTVLLAGSHT